MKLIHTTTFNALFIIMLGNIFEKIVIVKDNISFHIYIF